MERTDWLIAWLVVLIIIGWLVFPNIFSYVLIVGAVLIMSHYWGRAGGGR